MLLAAAAVIVLIVFGIRAIWPRQDAGTSPSKTPAVVVVIDPAHGGKDGGATAEGVFEKNIALAIANKIRAIAGEYPTLRLVFTRVEDADMSDEERITLASREAAQLYLAVHVNSFTSPTAAGIETLVDSTHKSGDAAWTFADSVQKAVIAETGAKDRTVKPQGTTYSRLTIPAASVLVGFISTPDERAKLIDPTYQDLIARGILRGVASYVATAGVTPASATQTVPLGRGQTADPAGKTP